MNIVTRFNTGDEVYCMLNNEIHSTLVNLIEININGLFDTPRVSIQYSVRGMDYYIMESDLFKTREEILKYLEDNIKFV